VIPEPERFVQKPVPSRIAVRNLDALPGHPQDHRITNARGAQ
jgi:hypothetical protein